MLAEIRNKFFQRQSYLILTLVFFCSVLLFYNLGQRSFWEPDEGRYAEISREMVESGDWLTPRLNYIKHFDKPPITYWLIGLSFKFFGQNEFFGHLPLVICAIIGILATFTLGQRLFGARCGFLSAVILSSCLGYPALARILSTDIIFSLFCLLSYLFFARKDYLLMWLFMALAFMTKGPVAFIIVLLPVSVYLIYQKEKHVFSKFSPGLLVFALVAFPWYIYQLLLNKGLLYDWLVQHTFGRVVRSTKQPFYFFVPVVIGLFFPWIFFLFSSLKRHFSFQKARLKQQHAGMLLLVLWFGLPFIFFSSIGKKLVPYVLPTLPALAIITARIWDEAMDNPGIIFKKIFALSCYIFLICLGILSLAMLVFLIMGYDYKLGVSAGRFNIIAMSVILAVGLISSLTFFKLKQAARLFAAITLTSSLFSLASIDMLSKIEETTGKSIKVLALKIKADLHPEDQIVTYRCFLKSLPFYLQRRIIVVERQRNLIYEEQPKAHNQYLLEDKTDLYRLLSLRAIRVFCITYTWEFEKIKQEYTRPVYLLDQAGKYVLFVNKK